MKKKILVYMETDTNDSDAFIKQDIKQELSCCSCYFEDNYHLALQENIEVPRG